MAKLEPSSLLTFSAAASALTLSTSRKLIRNFKYYRSDAPDMISRDNLIKLCRNIRQDAFGLQNLMENEENYPEFFVALARQIDDQLEELHRKILFFSASQIEEVVPLIDQQRSYWNNLTNPDFYSSVLIESLEHEIPSAIKRIETLIMRLPNSVSI